MKSTPRQPGSATTTTGRRARRRLLGHLQGSGASSASPEDLGRSARPTPQGLRAVRGLPFLALFAAASLALLLAPQALAHHSIGGKIGGETVGQPATPEGHFIQPRDVAYYRGTDGDPATDKILTLESVSNRGRVQRLDRHGNFERMWGKDVIDGNAFTGYEICLENCRFGHPQAASAAGTLGGEFDDPQGIAVNQSTGHVFVRDRDNMRVQEFDLDGDFVRAWGWDVVQEGTTHDTAADEFETCFIADECQPASSGSGAGQFAVTSTNGTGIAVDPTNGNVFAADPGNRRVIEFAIPISDSDPVTVEGAFGTAGTGDGEFNTNMPLRIAVDANRIVYASDTTGSGRIHRYDANAADFLAPISSPPLLAGGTGVNSTSGLEVDPDTGNLYVLRDPSSGATVVQEFTDPGGAPTLTIDSPHGSLGTTAANGLGYNPVTDEFLVAYNSPVFGLLALTAGPGGVEDVEVGAPQAIGHDTATLQGSLDPNVGVVSARFEVSRDGVDFDPVGEVVYVSGSGVQEVEVEIDGLDPATLYRVRLVATKQTGFSTSATVVSGEGTFLTDAIPPEAQTLRATAIRSTAATLQGSVDANGSATTYYFDYGTTTGYGNRVPLVDAPIGSSADPRFVFQAVTGLLPDTAYHYRIVAENAEGEVLGDDRTFVTRSSPSAPPGRAYELVSPADKVGGQGVGAYDPGDVSAYASGVASSNSDRYIVEANTGNVLEDGAFAYAVDWSFAERTATGWRSHSPFTRPNRGSAYNTFITPDTFSADFSLLTWSTNSAQFSVFPETELWGRGTLTAVLSDWQGRYELLAPTDPAQGEAARPAGGFGGGPAGYSQVVSADGSHAALSSQVKGMSGDGDPTADQPANGFTIYIDDVSAGLSDTFPGEGIREPVAVCTEGTELPSVDGSGAITSRECPDPVEYAPDELRDAALIDERGAWFHRGSLRNVISEDGSRLFFHTGAQVGATGTASVITTPCSGSGETTQCPTQLYVRDEDEAGEVTTRWISKPEVEGQEASLLGPAIFEGATPDGRKVYFRTTSPLTADDPNGEGSAPPGGVTEGAASTESWDLYEYEFPDAATDPGEGTLTRISAPAGEDVNVGAGSSGGSSNPGLRFLADDGRRAYFVTAAPIPGALERSGTITSPGGNIGTTSASNLYLYDAERPEGERWEFVARLDRTTGPMGECAPTGTNEGGGFNRSSTASGFLILSGSARCLWGSADGGLLTFFTDSRLVADDDASTGDVYGFDADAGELLRISRAQGGSDATYECAAGETDQGGAPAGGPQHCHGVPSIGLRPKLGVVTEPDDSDEKIAFFQSKARLVPEDTDDEYDVYMWRNGELSLLSTDTEKPAYYVGNSADGTNVYIMTREALTWQDTDAVADIYTVRIDGGISEPASSPACDVLGGDCQSAPTAPPPVQGGATATQPPPPAAQPEARDCSELAERARGARQRAKNRRQRAKQVRQRARRQARRGNAQRAKRLRTRANRVGQKAKKARRRAKRLRGQAQECRQRQGAPQPQTGAPR